MQRYVHATFCDDIREETGGKLTLVGIYAGSLLVPMLPVVVPRLCVLIEACTPLSEPFERLALKVFAGQRVLAQSELTPEQMVQALAATVPAGSHGRERTQRVSARLVLNALRLEGPMRIQVHVHTGDREFHANGLDVGLIAQAPSPGIAPPAGSRRH